MPCRLLCLQAPGIFSLVPAEAGGGGGVVFKALLLRLRALGVPVAVSRSAPQLHRTVLALALGRAQPASSPAVQALLRPDKFKGETELLRMRARINLDHPELRFALTPAGDVRDAVDCTCNGRTEQVGCGWWNLGGLPVLACPLPCLPASLVSPCPPADLPASTAFVALLPCLHCSSSQPIAA